MESSSTVSQTDVSSSSFCPTLDISSWASLVVRSAIGWWLSEFALQEHSRDAKSLLLVDCLSQNVVVGDRMKARLLKQLGQEL